MNNRCTERPERKKRATKAEEKEEMVAPNGRDEREGQQKPKKRQKWLPQMAETREKGNKSLRKGRNCCLKWPKRKKRATKAEEKDEIVAPNGRQERKGQQKLKKRKKLLPRMTDRKEKGNKS